MTGHCTPGIACLCECRTEPNCHSVFSVCSLGFLTPLLLLLLLFPLLQSQHVIAVEGLDLTDVQPGWYHQICLPARLVGSDGAPIRCLLQPLPEGAGSAHTEL